MNNAILTTRSALPNTSVLHNLAERWRSAGLYFACFDREGNVLWHDAHMPRLLALCLGNGADMARHIHTLPEAPQAEQIGSITPFTGVQMSLVPVARRRKLSAWVAILARTGPLAPNEDLSRAANKASLDVEALLMQSSKIPVVNPTLFNALVALAEQMHEDMQGAAGMNDELASVTEQLSSVYEEISLLYKISSGMRFSQKPEAFLESVCREVQEIGNFRAVAVALADRPDGTTPVIGNLAAMVGELGITGVDLIKGLQEPISEALDNGETQVHNDMPPDASWRTMKSTLSRLVCVPLQREHRCLGIMLAIDKNDGSEFNSVDLKLLNNVGSQCSIFMENAALYQDMQGLFMGVLHALTRSIDAKDAYTRGHSQRVAELSKLLAQRMGLSDELCERVYLSGLLHDVGKIGVPEAVLAKGGRLTDAEFDAIKKHPEIGGQILGNIKQLQDIIPGVLYHHERWDGRGYPYQLSGEDIPLMGRIIAVADSFDAMSSTRTYRPALPLETVLAEIVRCAGTQFDPTLAKIFVTLDFTPYQRVVEEHGAALKQNSQPKQGMLP